MELLPRSVPPYANNLLVVASSLLYPSVAAAHQHSQSIIYRNPCLFPSPAFAGALIYAAIIAISVTFSTLFLLLSRAHFCRLCLTEGGGVRLVPISDAHR